MVPRRAHLRSVSTGIPVARLASRFRDDETEIEVFREEGLPAEIVVAKASPAWPRGTINMRLKAMFVTNAITAMRTGVFMSWRA